MLGKVKILRLLNIQRISLYFASVRFFFCGARYRDPLRNDFIFRAGNLDSFSIYFLLSIEVCILAQAKRKEHS